MRLLAAALTTTAVLWLGALFVAPTALSQGRLPLTTFLVYEAGSHICHQRPERSFKWAGVQMPVCGRCLGLYVAGALGASAALVAGSRKRRVTADSGVLAVAAMPMLLSLGLEWLDLVPGSNVSRFVSSLPFGAVLAWTLIKMLISSPSRDQSSIRAAVVKDPR